MPPCMTGLGVVWGAGEEQGCWPGSTPVPHGFAPASYKGSKMDKHLGKPRESGCTLPVLPFLCSPLSARASGCGAPLQLGD